MPEKAARGRRVQGTEFRERITHRQQETGKVQFRKSQEKGGQGRACPHQWETQQKSLERAEIPTLMALSAGRDRQWWQRTCSQMVKPAWG